ncbi:MAG: hypothetical protein WBJ30_02765, partial [Tepidanaerobacteraceae bacterium]
PHASFRMHEFKKVGDVEKEAADNATRTTASGSCCYLFCVKCIVCHKKQLPKFFLEAVFVYSLRLYINSLCRVKQNIHGKQM